MAQVIQFSKRQQRNPSKQVIEDQCKAFLTIRDRYGAVEACITNGMSPEQAKSYVDDLADRLYIDDLLTSEEWESVRR